MNKNIGLPHSAHSVSIIAARTAFVFSATFLVILFLLHFLEPEFDPTWRMISEYELGHYDWMMRLAFFCWGSSVLSLLIALWPVLRTFGARIGRWWLLLIGGALFGAGIVVTNAITDTTTSMANTLHTLCGAFVILTFPSASSLVVGNLVRNKAWTAARRHLVLGEILVWLGLLGFIGSIIISDAINPFAGTVGPEVFLGWPNRFLVVAYNIWLIIIALDVKRFRPGS
jgi:hypothetical protein